MQRLILTFVLAVCLLVSCGEETVQSPSVSKSTGCECVATLFFKLKPTSTILNNGGANIVLAATVHEALASNDPNDPVPPGVPPLNPLESTRPRMETEFKGAKYTVGFDVSSLPAGGTITLVQLAGRHQQRDFAVNLAQWLYGSVGSDAGAVSLTPIAFGPYTNSGLDELHFDTLDSAVLSIPVADFTNVFAGCGVSWFGGPNPTSIDTVIEYDLELWVTVEVPEGTILSELCVSGGFQTVIEIVGSIPECD